MFHKQNTRQPIAAVLLALLLALTSAFSCIGLSGWASFRQQLTDLDAQYVTAAYGFNITSPASYTYQPEEIFEDGSMLFPDGVLWASPQRVDALVESAPGFLRRSANILAAAHTPNQKGTSSGAVDPMAYHMLYDVQRYAMSVMAVRCIGTEPNPLSDEAPFYRMEWIDPVCRMAAYDLPQQGSCFTFTRSTSDLAYASETGTERFPVFEIGKTYLMRGVFLDFPIQQRLSLSETAPGESETAENRWERAQADSRDPPYTQNIEFLYGALPTQRSYFAEPDHVGHPIPLLRDFSLPSREETIFDENGYSYTSSVPYVSSDTWPFYAAYEGDWRDFLNTAEGRVWRDEIIPFCEWNHDSVPVLLTDNVQSLSQFVKEESALLEGRMITPEEYESGAAVCMVSAEYALYNGLSVGDALALDLYKPAYATYAGHWELGAQPASFLYTACMPLVEENRLNIVRDYTIVGLYSAPSRPMDADGHGFRGDTVLAPKASAPEVVAEAEEDRLTPLANTILLKNGSIDAFEAYMAENGAPNRFRYYDYGYSAMKESIAAMADNALRLALLGSAAFLIGAAAFLLAGFARMAPAARGLRLLGANAKFVAKEMLSALFPVAAAGMLLGALLGGILYSAVCRAVLSEALAVNWPGLMVCATLELVFLFAAAAIWAALAARRSLMRRKKE